jgi:hypothetical protein
MPESVQGRVVRYERLRQQLAHARNPPDNFDGWADPVRLTLFFQLKAFIEFADGDPEIEVPEMRALVSALLDLENGVHNPLLAPRPTRNKPPPSLQPLFSAMPFCDYQGGQVRPMMKSSQRRVRELTAASAGCSQSGHALTTGRSYPTGETGSTVR